MTLHHSISTHISDYDLSVLTHSTAYELPISVDTEGGDLFRMLIEGTYKHLFGMGLQTLAKTIQQRVTGNEQ